jgi:hypothetical protein
VFVLGKHFQTGLIFSSKAGAYPVRAAYVPHCEQTPKACLLNKSTCLAAALGVTKFVAVITVNSVTCVVLHKSGLDVQQTGLLLYSLIRPGWKGLPGTNTLPHLAFSLVSKKKFYNIGPRCQCYKTFFLLC